MKPIQYQRGYTEFYKLKFKVTSDVLIPRPETELLVDEVLQYVRDSFPRQKRDQNDSVIANSAKPYLPTDRQSLVIFDLGTGAGNIAISIAKNLKKIKPRGFDFKIIATDISEKALKIARQNAKLHGVENKITFIKSDILSFFRHPGGSLRPISEACDLTILGSRFYRPDESGLQNDNPTIIVTNLPYIPSARIPYLDSSVKDFEPHIALDGGKDGFEIYRKLFQQISLPPRRWKLKLIIGEIDYTHGELARNEALKYFPEVLVEIKTDLAHKQRILLIRQHP